VQPARPTEDAGANENLEVTSRDQVREREEDDPPRLDGDPYSKDGLKAFDMVEEIADLEILDDGPNSDEPAEEVSPGEDALSAEQSSAPTSDESTSDDDSTSEDSTSEDYPSEEASADDSAEEDASGESGDGKYSAFGAYYPVPADETDFEDDYWEERPNGAHRATDISLEEGNPIYAVTDSVVYDVEQQWAGGNVLRLQSTESIPELGIREGDVFVYAHLSQFGDYAEGDTLAAGEQAGLTGNTGEWTTGPHLHFGWKRGEEEPNPYPLLSYLVENGS
jgi:murein DD-endopeptidase MepM/ murein hydrolase activator NlpD